MVDCTDAIWIRSTSVRIDESEKNEIYCVFFFLAPLTRKNINGESKVEKKVIKLEKQEQSFTQIVDVTELRQRLKAVRHHLVEAKGHQQATKLSTQNDESVE